MLTRSKSKSMENTGQDTDKRSEFALSMIEAFKDPSVICGLQAAITIDYEKIVDVVVARIEPRFKAMEERLQEKEREIERLEVRINDLEICADELEQYSRRSTIRITGVPELANEDIVQVTQQVLSHLSVSPAINRVHRVGPLPKAASQVPAPSAHASPSSSSPPPTSSSSPEPTNPKPRAILCQFLSYSDKAAVMKNRHILYDEMKGVHINEDLTRKRSNLLYKCRVLKRQKKILECWSYDGRIAVKDKKHKIVPIRSLSDTLQFN